MSRDNDVVAACREAVRAATHRDEAETVHSLIAAAGLDADTRAAIERRATELVREVRTRSKPHIMESFLAEYGLTTREGIALMCLAEALLRVPDTITIDALIEDKIAPSAWGRHLGHSSSPLVNASTWALLLTGKVLAESEEGLAGALHGVIKRLGEGVIRTAVAQAMKELGRQFVLGRNIDEAMERAQTLEASGYTYSYDMLGEAARTEADARRYHLAYSAAISALAAHAERGDIGARPGISVKLSALHPRFEFAQRDRVLGELAARTRSLALLARSAGIGFNIDAEEADRLDITLDVFEAVLADPALAGWDGFGIVVQTYARRAPEVLDWLYALAGAHRRRIMVRLVKGAYWDSEIKHAQVLGLDGYPVFTRKASTDVCYVACARKLVAMSDRIYPQFATHNAHSVAAVLEMDPDPATFEFQRLHGMGEALHEAVRAKHSTRCRIYAPVGAHRDLLAYLVRRLLENGANSSFVNQIVDEHVPAEEIAHDPFRVVEGYGAEIANPAIPAPEDLFGAARRNSRGVNLADPVEYERIDREREPFAAARWHAAPLIAGPVAGAEPATVRNPARPDDEVGEVVAAAPADVETALAAAAASRWSTVPVGERAECLRRASDLYEEHAAELFAIAAREAGKTLPDAVAEVREAVDFLRYYACEAERLADSGAARGPFACISPWNFPLAIFTGQLSAALAAGNPVLAKPAEQTPLIAARAVALLHEAGIPADALQLLPGDGPTVGGALAADPRVAGICFTGSTATAQRIHRTMAEHLDPAAPLIAETGGLNAMIVDSTALPEQTVLDVIASAFQSAGQRCSALRMLYVQIDIADRFLATLFGAMDELRVGDPWRLATDVGPVIDEEARAGIEHHCERMTAEGRMLKRLETPDSGLFVPPTVIRLEGIAELEQEIFGPVLHVATYRASDLEAVIDDVNAAGYGLTFGLHTRIDDRVQRIVDHVHAGNIYVNRNQIGAVVGSQPFGGEGLSGTGPKAGGPHYVRRFRRIEAAAAATPEGPVVGGAELQAAIDGLDATAWTRCADRGARIAAAVGEPQGTLGAYPEREMPGPTGESNRLSFHPRGTVLCLGPEPAIALAQATTALAQGNAVVVVASGVAATIGRLAAAGAPACALEGRVEPAALRALEGIAAVASNADPATQRELRHALAEREGAIVAIVDEPGAAERFILERHVCVDTTAAGGNASLLAAAGG